MVYKTFEIFQCEAIHKYKVLLVVLLQDCKLDRSMQYHNGNILWKYLSLVLQRGGLVCIPLPGHGRSPTNH